MRLKALKLLPGETSDNFSGVMDIISAVPDHSDGSWLVLIKTYEYEGYEGDDVS